MESEEVVCTNISKKYLNKQAITAGVHLLHRGLHRPEVGLFQLCILVIQLSFLQNYFLKPPKCTKDFFFPSRNSDKCLLSACRKVIVESQVPSGRKKPASERDSVNAKHFLGVSQRNFFFPPSETQRLTRGWRNGTEAQALGAVCLSQGCRVGGGEVEEGQQGGVIMVIILWPQLCKDGDGTRRVLLQQKPVLSTMPGCDCITICLALLVGSSSEIQVFLENNKIQVEESLPQETSGTNK